MLDSELCSSYDRRSIWSGKAQKRCIAPETGLKPTEKPYNPRSSPRSPVRARLGAGKALFEAFTASARIPHLDVDKLPPT